MYKPTIWKDHVEGVQEGTDMNAANFNNIEVGTMESNALAALHAAISRYSFDVAKNNEMHVIPVLSTDPQNFMKVNIPEYAKRNNADYKIIPVLGESADNECGEILVDFKEKDSFKFKIRGNASEVIIDFYIYGGMI